MTGKLIGIARRAQRRAPMECLDRGDISLTAGLAGDFKGAKHKTRQITMLAEEAWQQALNELPEGAQKLSWTVRRANFLVENIRLPRAKGARLAVGPVILEVTGQTYPCRRMEDAFPGLLKALAVDWRGGVTCKVVQAGPVSCGDPVSVLSSPREITRKLPG